MTKPALVIMAAGMGSRYGGLKQVEPISEQGEIIIDFSLYDAMMAGFEDIIFIIKKEIEEDVRARIDEGAGKHLNIKYVFQDLADLPAGYSVPEGRVKPWGTCHAVMAARKEIKGNFVVINADDYYGPQAFQLMYEELIDTNEAQGNSGNQVPYPFSMVGYKLVNTLTEYGHVARGVCTIDEKGRLVGVEEMLKIQWRNGKIENENEDGTWREVDSDATVSMNFWGFTPQILAEMEEGFPAFLDAALKDNPLKAEYLLPRKVDELLKEGKAEVKILHTDERWFGVTYKEDKEQVVDSIKAMKDKGMYPEQLW